VAYHLSDAVAAYENSAPLRDCRGTNENDCDVTGSRSMLFVDSSRQKMAFGIMTCLLLVILGIYTTTTAIPLSGIDISAGRIGELCFPKDTVCKMYGYNGQPCSTGCKGSGLWAGGVCRLEKDGYCWKCNCTRK